MENIDIDINIDKDNLKNIDIDIDIDKDNLKNIDIDIDIDKRILQNIDIDNISYRLGFGISNTPQVSSVHARFHSYVLCICMLTYNKYKYLMVSLTIKYPFFYWRLPLKALGFFL